MKIKSVCVIRVEHVTRSMFDLIRKQVSSCFRGEDFTSLIFHFILDLLDFWRLSRLIPAQTQLLSLSAPLSQLFFFSLSLNCGERDRCTQVC